MISSTQIFDLARFFKSFMVGMINDTSYIKKFEFNFGNKGIQHYQNVKTKGLYNLPAVIINIDNNISRENNDKIIYNSIDDIRTEIISIYSDRTKNILKENTTVQNIIEGIFRETYTNVQIMINCNSYTEAMTFNNMIQTIYPANMRVIPHIPKYITWIELGHFLQNMGEFEEWYNNVSNNNIDIHNVYLYQEPSTGKLLLSAKVYVTPMISLQNISVEESKDDMKWSCNVSFDCWYHQLHSIRYIKDYEVKHIDVVFDEGKQSVLPINIKTDTSIDTFDENKYTQLLITQNDICVKNNEIYIDISNDTYQKIINTLNNDRLIKLYLEIVRGNKHIPIIKNIKKEDILNDTNSCTKNKSIFLKINIKEIFDLKIEDIETCLILLQKHIGD